MLRIRELESADADFLGVMLYARLADVEYEPGDDLGRMIPTLTA